MRTLELTSPPMRGDDVKTLQTELIKDRYLADTADGIYGDLTAQAVHRAKYWLGYRVPDKTAAQLLVDYLTGKRKPTKAMLERTAARKKQQGKVPLRQKALRNLSNHIGEKESPAGSNRIAFASGWYGLVGPWCAMAVTRAYVDAGSKAFARGKRYAYVPYIVSDARRGVNSLTVTKSPQPGDLVCFDWDGGVADHIGLYEKRISATEFWAIEGNTSADAGGSQSNGGMVARRRRHTSQVEAFVHVGG